MSIKWKKNINLDSPPLFFKRQMCLSEKPNMFQWHPYDIIVSNDYTSFAFFEDSNILDIKNRRLNYM